MHVRCMNVPGMAGTSSGGAANQQQAPPATPPQANPTTGPLPNPWAARQNPNPNANANPFPNPFGFGGMGGMPPSAAMPSAAQMTSMMGNPMFQQMMNQVAQNPHMMEQAMQSNPMFQQMLASNPQMAQMMRNPGFLQQSMNMMRQNPQLMQQAMQQMGGMPGMGGMGGMGGMPNFFGGFGQPPVQPQNDGGLDFSSLFGNPTAPAANSQTQQSAQNPPSGSQQQQQQQTPQVRFASQLQQMRDMGFFDEYSNIRALEATNGNVNTAIDRLLSGNI